MADEMGEGQVSSVEVNRVRKEDGKLRGEYSGRNDLFGEMDSLYLMDWDEESEIRTQQENAKITRSPRARNQIKGAVRLLVAADPIFSVPHELNNEEARQKSEALEGLATGMWHASGKIMGNPIHYDLTLAALLYSEIHATVNKTDEMLSDAEGASIGVMKRAESIAKRTSYLFDATNPGDGYPVFGAMGLDRFHSQRKITAGEFVDRWGQDGVEALRASKKFLDSRGDIDRFTDVMINDSWDLTNRYVYIDGSDRPVRWGPHGLPFIPIVAQLVDGSKLFPDLKHQREPFLYTLWKSGIWNRQNTILTVAFSILFAIGVNPTFVFESSDPESDPIVDFSIPGGWIKLNRGERFEPLAKNAVPAELLNMWQIADELSAESTIYPQALGEPVGANAPYSAIALLNQVGRLPLTQPQRKLGWGIGELLEKAIQWMRHDQKPARASAAIPSQAAVGASDYSYIDTELTPDQVPEQFEIVALVEISLPQDHLNNANIAVQLSAGADPLVSQRWAREKILNIGQSTRMTNEIHGEQARKMMHQNWMAIQQFKFEQLQAAASQIRMGQQQQQGPPGGNGAGPINELQVNGGSPATATTPNLTGQIAPDPYNPPVAPGQQGPLV